MTASSTLAEVTARLGRTTDAGVRIEYTPNLDGDPDPGEVVFVDRFHRLDWGLQIASQYVYLSGGIWWPVLFPALAIVLAAAGKHFSAGANLKKRVDDAAAGTAVRSASRRGCARCRRRRRDRGR